MHYSYALAVLLSHPTVGELVSLCVAAQPADGKMRRLLHDIAELTSQGKLTLSLHAAGFHKHDLSPEGSPGQANGHAGLTQAFRHLKERNTGKSLGNGWNRTTAKTIGELPSKQLYPLEHKS